ncbi:MAG: tetraacyldisaccharide 4'-kinase [Bryobacteraceae bacterium]
MSTAKTVAILSKTIKARLIYFLYRVLQIALSPALALYILYRGIRNPAYFEHVEERLGVLPRTFDSTGMGSLWLHAVSVGEVLSAVELIRRLRDARPDLDIFVSTATLAGRATAEQRLSGMVRGIFYAPLDYCSVVRRVLRKVRPAAVVVMETEIWPNLYREAKRSGASLIVVNGRISDRALPRYRRWSWFFRHALELPDAIWVQSAQDAKRYVLAGAPKDRVVSAGNLKYDFQPPKEIAPDIAEFLDRVAPSAVWVAASTMPAAVPGDPDEDDVVIDAFRKVRRDGLLLILAPRRPERFEVVAEKLKAAGVPFVRRSQLRDLALPGVLLLDSIGELAAVFQRASVVFIGGTLASRGGHNILEPAYFAKPVIVGPHMENFAEMAAEFTAANAVVQIADGSGLTAAVNRVLEAPGETGKIAQQLAMAKRGVVDRVTELVLGALGDGVPNPSGHSLLQPFTFLWAFGHRRNLARGQRMVRSLETRVVSVGGLTMGGTGKSPFVLHLAARLREAKKTPAILTRGYRRKDASAPLVVHLGATASVEQTGDEAQMFIRRGVAHVGISPNRYDTGSLIVTRLEPDIFLLDDGFQHVKLRRDVDIVLLDATNPWGGGLFPVGLRREPLEALSRAHAIVLTRVPRGAATTGLEKMIRGYNGTAPIFRSRMVPEPWSSPARKVAAFCGIGSPGAFWRTLEELGLEVDLRDAFPDHHRYQVSELETIARAAQSIGAEALVTTEKDMMNLPEGIRLPLAIECVRIGVEIENEAELLRLVEGRE